MAATVVTGGGLTSFDAAVARTATPLQGQAVVLTRLSPPTPVSSALVHELVDILTERGCTSVTIGTQLRAGDRDRGHEGVVELARGAGLGGRTARGNSYDVVDLAVDGDTSLAPAPSVLHRCAISARWATAATRVLLGRAVTDLLDGYAAGLDALLRAGEEVVGATAADVVTDLLDLVPPTLVVIDALAPSVGPDGARLPRVLDADTLVVGTDVLAVDSAVAVLLGQDRGSSRLFAAAHRAREAGGGGVGRTDAGVVAPLAGARGPHPAARAAALRLAADPGLERVLIAAVGGPDDGAAAPDPVLAVVRAVLTPLVGAASDGAGALALASVLDTVATATHGVLAWQTGLDKSAVVRRVVPLGFDAEAIDGSRYDGLPDFFAEFDDLLDGFAPVGDDAMRWRLVDGATVFETTRDVAADFDSFVARVDVAEGISLMADYLGGRRLEVPGGASGATRQAERNLYLPQPNYLAAWGGEPIDVCKIELVERSRDQHRLTWRTLHSPNGSAVFDDGSLTFARSDRGTLVRVRGRQLFSLPASWSGIDLAAIPEVRGPLLEEAYRRFFATTFDNLEACFEGREFRIGRPPRSPTDPLLTRSLEVLLGATRSWLDDRAGAVGGSPTTPGAARSSGPSPSYWSSAMEDSPAVDLHGFRHVRGVR